MQEKEKHYEIIKKEILYLISKKDKFMKLYGTKETVELLNKIDGHCFGFIQQIYNDSIILSLTKLIDPMKSGRNKNIVLETLINDVDDLKIKEELYEQLNIIRKFSKIYKEQRNKVIAHSDYNTYYKKQKTYLAVKNDEINKIIEQIIVFMNKVEKSHSYQICTYELIYDINTDCETLIYKLNKIKEE